MNKWFFLQFLKVLNIETLFVNPDISPMKIYGFLGFLGGLAEQIMAQQKNPT